MTGRPPEPLVLSSFADASRRLGPEEYSRLLRSVQLRSIALESVEARVQRDRLRGEPLELRIDMGKRTARLEADEQHIFIVSSLAGRAGRRRAVFIRAVYRLVLTGAQHHPPDFLAIYSEVSGVPQLWPYLRELADTLTGRMGLPRLVLPLLASRAPAARGQGPAADNK